MIKHFNNIITMNYFLQGYLSWHVIVRNKNIDKLLGKGYAKLF